MVRGALPKPAPPDVELLRLEYVLSPAIKQQAAERATRKALLQVAKAMNLPEPPPHQLRQVQVMHGALVALLGVPRAQACDWLSVRSGRSTLGGTWTAPSTRFCGHGARETVVHCCGTPSTPSVGSMASW